MRKSACHGGRAACASCRDPRLPQACPLREHRQGLAQQVHVQLLKHRKAAFSYEGKRCTAGRRSHRPTSSWWQILRSPQHSPTLGTHPPRLSRRATGAWGMAITRPLCDTRCTHQTQSGTLKFGCQHTTVYSHACGDELTLTPNLSTHQLAMPVVCACTHVVGACC